MSLNWHQHSRQTGAAVICSKHSHHHTSHVHHHHPTSISGFYLLVILFTQPGHQLSFIIIWPFCHLLGRSKTGVLCNAGRPSLLLIQHRSRDACAGTRGPSPACTQLSTCVSATALFSLKVLHSEVLRYTETGNSLSTFTLM